MNDNIIPSIILHPGELAQFPLNANSHPPAQIDELVASRERFNQYRNVVGWRCPHDIETQTADGQPVTLKKGVMYVIAGNGFHQASVKRQDDSIEVKDYSHLSLEEAILLAETDNAAPLGAQRLVEQLRANLERARGLYQDDERMRRMFDRLKIQMRINGNEANDPYEEWQGMPEFENEEAFGAVATVKVHFATLEDISKFSQLAGQTVNEYTTFIWFPKQERENLKPYKVVDES